MSLCSKIKNNNGIAYTFIGEETLFIKIVIYVSLKIYIIVRKARRQELKDEMKMKKNIRSHCYSNKYLAKIKLNYIKLSSFQSCLRFATLTQSVIHMFRTENTPEPSINQREQRKSLRISNQEEKDLWKKYMTQQNQVI